jgi:hypothetical protein
MRRRRTQRRSRKTKGGACGSCMMPQVQPVQSGGKCPCAAASKLPIIFGGVRRNRNNRRKTQRRVRFA